MDGAQDDRTAEEGEVRMGASDVEGGRWTSTGMDGAHDAGTMSHRTLYKLPYAHSNQFRNLRGAVGSQRHWTGQQYGIAYPPWGDVGWDVDRRFSYTCIYTATVMDATARPSARISNMVATRAHLGPEKHTRRTAVRHPSMG